jgi:polygalacturonase
VSQGTLSLLVLGLAFAGTGRAEPKAPRVLLAVPASAATVSGLVRVNGDLAHDRHITRVELLADGRAVASVSRSKEFSLTWDATKASRGKHTLTVKASDAEGRVGSASVEVVVRQTFNVKERGARGNGNADDTQAIQAALDAARKAGGGTVYFPKGTYLVSPRTTGGFAVGSNTEVRGDGPASVLKVANNTGDYNFLFGQLNAASDYPFVENIAFRDLRVDQNPAGNRTADIRETEGIQNVLQFHHFKNLSVERVHFDPAPGIQAIVLDSPKPNTGGVTIDGCFFRFVRGRSTLAHKHDHSSIYTETRNALIRNNTVQADLSQCAITAVEVHSGPQVRVQGNKIDGFQVGVIVVNAAPPNADVSDGQFVVQDNQILRTTQGVALWSHTGRTLRGVTIKDNQITMAHHLLYRDVWLGIFLYDHETGQATRGDFEHLAVVNNKISFEQLKPGAIIAVGIDLAPAGRVQDVLVKGNSILASPASGIRLGNPARGKTLQDVRVEDNTIVDAGWDATTPKHSRAAILLDKVRLTNVQVTRNAIKDTGKPGSPRGYRAISAHPAAASKDVRITKNQITPPRALLNDMDRATVRETER